MTTGSRTEGIKGIGSEGFIRTVKSLTVTGDLVVHGETKSTVGKGHDVSAFWETADANANYWAYDLPTGGSVAVPVMGVGIGLKDVDLGLFNGVTQTTFAVLDADRDSYLILDFSADDSPRIRSNQDITISGNVVFSDNITVNGTTTTVSSSVVIIDDPLFHLANDNPANSVDLGIIAEYTDSGKKFAGLFRDASDSDKWKLFATTGNSHEEPSTTVNTTSGFTLGNLAVNELEGTLATAAQTNITSVGALDGGSITSNFGTINTGSSTITTSGTVTGGTLAGTLSTAAQTNVTSVGALDGGSITSNFGTIDTGASTITTTGLISGGSLDIDNVLINGTTIGHTDDTDLLTVADGILTLAGKLIVDGDRSLTPGDGGAIHLDTHTVTDSNTSGSGTATKYTHVNIEAPTLAATNSSVTTTNAATLYISAAATAGTNQTITNNYALWVDSGATRFDGAVTVDGNLTFTGAQTIGTTSGDITLDPTGGSIIIDQGAADVKGIDLRNSDVSHAMTALTDANTYFSVQKVNNGQGGVFMRGLTDGASQCPFFIRSTFGNASPSNTAIILQGAKSDGSTGEEALASGEQLLEISNYGTVQFRVYGDGRTHWSGGGYLELVERAAPGAGAANTARIYSIVDGGGLTDLAAVFQDGTVDIFAQESTPLDSPIFTYPSGTEVRIVMRKPHPGKQVFEMVYPGGEAFVLREIEHYDVDQIAASVGSVGSLPGDWDVTTAAERAANSA